MNIITGNCILPGIEILYYIELFDHFLYILTPICGRTINIIITIFLSMGNGFLMINYSYYMRLCRFAFVCALPTIRVIRNYIAMLFLFVVLKRISIESNTAMDFSLYCINNRNISSVL